MIPPQIKSLFEFIDYLHSNIDNFGQYMGMINRAKTLKGEEFRLNPHSSFQDRQRENEIEAEIKKLVNIIDKNIVQPMYAKARELNTFDPDHKETVWNRNYAEVINLTQQATADNLTEILSYTRKYLAFRRSGEYTDYLFTGFLFNDLDKLVIQEIHNYFSGENLTEGKPITLQPVPQRVELETLQVVEQKPDLKRFIANEYALAYIFDLYASGNAIPTNPIEGGYDAKELKRVGEEKLKRPREERAFDKPDSFYKAVIHVARKFDLNDPVDLSRISLRWLDAVKALSDNWETTKTYLDSKKLL